MRTSTRTSGAYGLAGAVGHRPQRPGVRKRAMALVDRPGHRGTAVDADIDALQRGQAGQHLHAGQHRHLEAVDRQRQVPPKLLLGLRRQDHPGRAGGQFASVEGEQLAVLVVGQPHVTVLDVDVVAPALVAVGHEDALVPGAVVEGDLDDEGPERHQLGRAVALQGRRPRQQRRGLAEGGLVGSPLEHEQAEGIGQREDLVVPGRLLPGQRELFDLVRAVRRQVDRLGGIGRQGRRAPTPRRRRAPPVRGGSPASSRPCRGCGCRSTPSTARGGCWRPPRPPAPIGSFDRRRVAADGRRARAAARRRPSRAASAAGR